MMPKTSGLAIASLVLGILSIPTCCCYGFGMLIGIAAIITGAMGISQVNKAPQEFGGKGMAIAGLVCGIVSVVLGILSLVLGVAGQVMQNVQQ